MRPSIRRPKDNVNRDPTAVCAVDRKWRLSISTEGGPLYWSHFSRTGRI